MELLVFLELSAPEKDCSDQAHKNCHHYLIKRKET
jgi:hypothetical protein